MALTIEQIQANITAKGDAREIINQIADYIQANPGGGGGSSYLVWKGLVSQSGTDAPTVVSNGTGVNTPFGNTLGGDLVFSYDDVGEFRATLNGAFTAAKVFVYFKNFSQEGSGGFSYAARANDNYIGIYSYSTDASTPANDIISIYELEIQVYP